MNRILLISLGAALGANARYWIGLWAAKYDEYAALVQHIFANAYLNGEVIRLDGGIRMAAR